MTKNTVTYKKILETDILKRNPEYDFILPTQQISYNKKLGKLMNNVV